MSQWIWKFGEMEIYHNLLLHNRRQQYGYPEPPVWKIYSPDSAVAFRKKVVTDGGMVRILGNGNISTVLDNGTGYLGRTECGGRRQIQLPAGEITIEIRVSNWDTFPCIYVDGVVESDDSWEADDLSHHFEPVGTNSLFSDPCHSPEVFPFAYENITYTKKEEVSGGVLFDFGKEVFARTCVTGLGEDIVTVCFGESREEALDQEWSVIHYTQRADKGKLEFPQCALRYVFVGYPDAEITAEYEYLPLAYRGEFRCDEEIVNRVWDVAAYTFHLNSREFFLDGIKRDRWVWSADAYQSLFVNRYLFFDESIEQRTLIALAGKTPLRMHLNSIMDYSFFWVISLYEHYRTYGNRKFLEQIYPRLKEIMDFCRGRVSADGFMREMPGDWIFIDWAPMDKTGAVCGEQILFSRALTCYSELCSVIGKPEDGCREQAKELQTKIFAKFYDADKRVFIDSFESGNRNVTRHNNILAYLFLPCSEEQKKDIYERVILNDDVRQITTPYFKFYENQVHCEEGNDNLLEESIRNYYGSMLDTGATTLYEEFDPTMSGAQHYAMYGNPYQKSLCHAWSASPIYLLGCYRLGVKNTGVAYSSFEVRPKLGDLKGFNGKVPVPGGDVAVAWEDHMVRVKADIPGGKLYLGNRVFVLEPGKEICVDYEES